VLGLLPQVFFKALQSFDVGSLQDENYQTGSDPTSQSFSIDADEEIELDVTAEMAVALHAYASANMTALGLEKWAKIQVRGFHPVFRVAPNGRLLIELVAQFTQVDHSLKEELGGLPFRGGCTLIASSNGAVRYLVSKPMREASGDPNRAHAGELRLARQRAYVEQCDMRNPLTPYYDLKGEEYRERMVALMNLASLHGG
jgi:hypothetical protein